MSRNRVGDNTGKNSDGWTIAPEDRIRLRAYEKFCQRGNAPDDPIADWLDAERELREEQRAERTTEKTRSGAVAFSH